MVCNPVTAPFLLGTAVNISVCSPGPEQLLFSSFVPCLLFLSDPRFSVGQDRRLGRMSLKTRESSVGWNGAQPPPSKEEEGSYLIDVEASYGV